MPPGGTSAETVSGQRMAGISEENLSRLGEFVAARLGLSFPRPRLRDLERGIGSAAAELGFEDGAACVEWLLSSPLKRSHIETLAGHLTVGETYFFRDRKIFQTLEEAVLPELIQNRRKDGKRIRIWSAGCSTGEEPYSIAILLSRMIPDLSGWTIPILATDINVGSLRKAAGGLYGRWSFRDVEPRIKEKFFDKKDGGRLEVLPGIRKMVTFSYLNLVEDTYPSLFNNTTAMDIIFCRNVLMYLVPDLAMKVVQNFHRCLSDGGFLIVSPSELSGQMFSQFACLSFPGAMIYRKETNSSRPSGFPPERPVDRLFPLRRPVGLSMGLVRAPSVKPAAWRWFRMKHPSLKSRHKACRPQSPFGTISMVRRWPYMRRAVIRTPWKKPGTCCPLSVRCRGNGPSGAHSRQLRQTCRSVAMVRKSNLDR